MKKKNPKKTASTANELSAHKTETITEWEAEMRGLFRDSPFPNLDPQYGMIKNGGTKND